jgi:hypothetical protein
MTDETNEPMPVKPAIAPPLLPATATPEPRLSRPQSLLPSLLLRRFSTAVAALSSTPFRQQALIRINDAIGFLQKP